MTQTAEPTRASASDFESATRAHAAHYVRLLETAAPLLRGSGQPDGGRTQLRSRHLLRIELGNINTSLADCLRRPDPAGLMAHARYLLPVLDGLSEFGLLHQHYLKLAACEAASEQPKLGALALAGRARAHFRRGEMQLTSDAAQQACELARRTGDQALLAHTVDTCALAAFGLGDLEAARRLHVEAADLFTSVNDEQGRIGACKGLGNVEWMQGNMERAAKMAEEHAQYARSVGDEIGAALLQVNIAIARSSQLEPWQTVALMEAGIPVLREAGDRSAVANNLHNIGCIHIGAGNFEAGRKAIDESLAMHRELGVMLGILNATISLGSAEMMTGQFQAAEELFRDAEQRSRSLKLDHQLALVRSYQAQLYWRKGQPGPAASKLVESLEQFQAMGKKQSVLVCGTLAAAILAAAQDWEGTARALHGSARLLEEYAFGLELDMEQALTSASDRLNCELEAGRLSRPLIAEVETATGLLTLEEFSNCILNSLRQVAGSSPA